MAVSTLKGLAKASNTGTFRNMDVRQGSDLEAATWDETEEEAKKRWIWFDEGEHDGSLKFGGRRFSIKQSHKMLLLWAELDGWFA